jgi:purine-binding chemotaxis protein CheW
MLARRQMIVFKIGAEEFAIDISLTKEIVPIRPITPIPETQSYVTGVMNLRGNLVPILDLRARLRAGKSSEGGIHTLPADARIMIVKLEGNHTGLIVDGASEVIRVTDEMIEPPPDIITEIGADYIGGVIHIGDRFITVLDLHNALTGNITHELEEIHRLLAAGPVQVPTPVRA